MSEIVRMVVVLSLIAGICSAVLTMANQGLAPQIEKQTDLYVRGPALERLFGKPAREVLNNKVVIDAGDTEIPVFYLKDGENVSTLAIEATGKGGYGGDLKLMIGIDLVSGRQTGLEVVSHSETPGLGARIEEPGFRRQWQGLPSEGKVALTGNGGEIDAISGATTTSRAAVGGTNEALLFLQNHKEEILKSISDIEEQS
ncbi:MAG TPA: RnfABCDGE type electron transport complex subunit G [Desulfopila sp.]|nr:RnfABCDGE type electron transport complex subunit G [Desulfopila sp.]